MAITVNELPTPEENPEAYNGIWIANSPCPGLCLPIDGDKKRAVNHSKDKGASKDLLVDNGPDLTEATIRIKTWDGDTYRKLYEFYLKYMDPDRVLSRLNIVPVWHPYFYVRGIKQGYFYSAPIPKPTSDTGVRPMISTFTMKIIGPNTKIRGIGGSTKPKLSASGVSSYKPQSGVANAVSAINSILPITSGFNAGSLFSPENGLGPVFTPPPSIPSPLLTPQGVQQLSDAGDSTAQFVNSLLGQAAPLR